MSDDKKPPPKQTPQEKLALLMLLAEADEAMEATLAMSDEEIRRDLESAGVDIAAEEAEMRALLVKHGALEPEVDKPEANKPADVIPLAARRRSRRPWLALALAAAVLLAVAWQWSKRGLLPEGPDPHPVWSAAPPPPTAPVATPDGGTEASTGATEGSR